MRLLLTQDSEEAKNKIIKFVYHRLSCRYIRPLKNIPLPCKSGFLIMAAACLMIETLDAFKKGVVETEWKDGGRAFQRFFTKYADLFPGLASFEKFHKHIRCGILHQAETTGGYRIFRKGVLFDKDRKIINANLFLDGIKKALGRYALELKRSKSDEKIWTNAKNKVGFICDNCETD